MSYKVYFIVSTIFLSTVFASPVLEGITVTSSEPEKYPYVVRLTVFSTTFKNATHRLRSAFICTGIIVKWNIILTAAHCLTDNIDEPEVTVRAGILDMKRKNQVAKMIDYKIHEDFDDDPTNDPSEEYFPNDLALIWLHENLLQTPKVHLAKINDGSTSIYSKTGYVVGWGLNGVDENGSKLTEGEMQVIPNIDCEMTLETRLVTSFCVQAANKKTGPCMGDSGGPFVIGDEVVGISSWGITYSIGVNGKITTTCKTSKPTVFVKLDFYDTWIKTHTAPKSVIKKTSCSAKKFRSKSPT